MALTDNLVAYYKLDEASGNAIDSSGNGNTATNVNTATYSSGKINNGINLASASSQKLNIADSTSVSITGAISIAFWINTVTNPTSGNVVGLVTKDTASTSGRSFWVDNFNNAGTQQLRFGIHADGGATNFAYSFINQTFTTSTWFHVVLTCTPTNAIGTKFEFFINGTSSGNGTAANSGTGATAIFDSTTPLVIGAYDTSGLFANAMFDEVGLWSRALSSAEVTQLYNGGLGLAYPFTTATPSRLMMMGVG